MGMPAKIRVIRGVSSVGHLNYFSLMPSYYSIRKSVEILTIIY